MSVDAAHVRELIELPACDPNVSEARVDAAGPAVVVVYESKAEGWPDTENWSAVRFDSCIWFARGGPNDEAFSNHPLSPLGLRPYSLQEVIQSPFIATRAAIQVRSGCAAPAHWTSVRHFVFAMKEDTFECLASTYTLIGSFPTLEEATSAARASIP